MERVDWQPNELEIPRRVRGLVFGPSGSGKSTLVYSLISNPDFSNFYERIYYVYPSLKDCASEKERNVVAKLEAIPNLQLLDTLPFSIEEVCALSENPNKQYLLINDDSENVFSSPGIDALYRRLSNHLGIHCLSISQRAYCSKQPFYSSIWNCSNFFIYFRPVSDHLSLTHLGRKVFGAGGAQYLTAAMKKAHQLLGNHCYICIDLSTDKKSTLKFPVRTLIVPQEGVNVPGPILFPNPTYS